MTFFFLIYERAEAIEQTTGQNLKRERIDMNSHSPLLNTLDTGKSSARIANKLMKVACTFFQSLYP